jgi:hypothetical protein
MALELTHYQIHPVGQTVTVALDLNQGAVVDERAKVALEGDALVAGDAELAQQLARRSRMRHALADAP